MSADRIRSIGVVGNGVAAWLAAAALARALASLNLDIVVVETDAPPSDPPALAAFPPLRALHRSLGLHDGLVAAEAAATFRLGTRYVRDGGEFLVGYGGPAGATDGVPPHQLWRRLDPAPFPFGDLMPALAAARIGRAGVGPWPRDLGWLAAGLHLDSAGYRALLRDAALAAGVRRVPGAVRDVRRHGERVEAILLAEGDAIAADLWIDTGPAEGPLRAAAWLDWSPHLPFDRLVWTRASRPTPPPAVATARATAAGWATTVPLRDADIVLLPTGPTGVATAETALAGADGTTIASHPLRPGRVARFFVGNVLTLGEGAVCLGAVDGTELHLLQSAVAKLATHFPDRDCGAEAAHIDRLLIGEAERALDFQTLLAGGAGSAAAPTVELARKLAIWDASGRVSLLDNESFFEPAWAAALLALQPRPRGVDALAATIPVGEAAAALRRAAAGVKAAAERLPPHDEVLRRATAEWHAGERARGAMHA